MQQIFALLHYALGIIALCAGIKLLVFGISSKPKTAANLAAQLSSLVASNEISSGPEKQFFVLNFSTPAFGASYSTNGTSRNLLDAIQAASLRVGCHFCVYSISQSPLPRHRPPSCRGQPLWAARSGIRRIRHVR